MSEEEKTGQETSIIVLEEKQVSFRQIFGTPENEPVETEVDNFMVGHRMQGIIFDHGDHFGWIVTDNFIDEEYHWLNDEETFDPEFVRGGCCDTLELARKAAKQGAIAFLALREAEELESDISN